MKKGMSDKDIISQLHTSPSSGIETALTLYGGAVKAICKSILIGGADEDIEEAIADTFVALWQSIDRFNPKKCVSLKCYLYGIARKTAQNKKRSLLRKKPTLDIESYETMLTSEKNCEQTLLDKLDNELLHDAILDLGEPDKSIFIHKYFLGESGHEISELLHMKPKFIENRLFRGKKKLQAQLEKRGYVL